MDPGLKQWIITGASMAVSFIPVAGPLISCVMDGTFVDMWNAIQRGDWGTLALSCAAFVPGAGKLAKVGLKSFERVGIKSSEKTFARIMGEKELGSVLKTGKIQSKSGRTYFAEASHISKNSGASANKFALPEEKKCFVEFRIKNNVEIHGPSIVESKYGRIGGGIEHWIDEGSFIDADIVSYGRFP